MSPSEGQQVCTSVQEADEESTDDFSMLRHQLFYSHCLNTIGEGGEIKFTYCV